MGSDLPAGPRPVREPCLRGFFGKAKALRQRRRAFFRLSKGDAHVPVQLVAAASTAAATSPATWEPLPPFSTSTTKA